MNIQTCKSFSESVALYLPQDLFLKPLARLYVSVQLPPSKATGKTISNWELMERMREIIQPETFTSLKVVKSSSESIRFEGEIEDKRKLSAVIATLDDRSVKLNGYPEFLKLKASESKLEFPTRHTWDSFFRDASNMDEMKHGERPDTVHIANLPIKWFVSPRDVADDDAKPSENIFRKVFERFGKIRCVDIPICDPYRKQMKAHMTGISTFSFDSELYFEGYVQFSEYMGFVRAMDAFRGMKLVRKLSDGTGQAVTVRVDFDQTKHLSDASVKRRSIVRERLVGRERAKEEKEKEESLKRQNKDEAERRKAAQSERDKLSHTQEREERRKAKQLAKLKEKESKEINSKIAEEQKKLIKTQRKLQSIRLIEELFRRIQLKHKPAAGHKREDSHRDLYNVQNRRDKDNKKELKKIEKALLLENKEKSVRERLVKKYKSAQEQELEEQRQKLKKAIEGNIVLRSVLDTGKKRLRTPSISSLSSGSDICLDDFPDKKIKTERMTSPERNSFIKKEGEALMPGYSGQVPQYNYGPYTPYMNPNYNYPNQMGNYFPRGGYYPPTAHQEQGGPPPYNPRGRGGFISRRARGGVYNANHNPHRGGYRGGPRMPFFDGPNANHAYYKYFKKLAEGQTGDYLERDRSYSRSRSRSRRRSYSRSRSRSSSRSRSRSRRRSSSRRRSRYSRSRSRHSRSRSRNRRTRTRSRSRSRSRRSRSRSRDRSKSRRRRSHSKRTQSREKSPDAKKSTDFIPRAVRENADRPKADERDSHLPEEVNPKEPETEAGDARQTLGDVKRDTSKSWSPPGQGGGEREAWSESPSPKK